jgi:hypothetical protein
VPGSVELAEILGRRLHRHTGERHAVTAGGQRDLEQPGGDLRVLVEHLVEVADPIEEDRVGVPCLDLPPVLQHRRSRGTGGLAAHGRHGFERGDWRGIRWAI